MQEGQTVSFAPMYVDGPLPWFTKLFAFYLLIVVVLFFIRVVKLVANLRKLREPQEHRVIASRADDVLWVRYHAGVQSLKELAVLTFLLSLLDLAWYTADVFLSVRTAKTVSSAYVLVATCRGLDDFAIGLAFCVVLYLAALLFQIALRHRNTRIVGT